MPTTYQSKSIEGAKRGLTVVEQAQRDNLAILVRAYDAVRRTRCPQRDEAERALGIALSRYDQPFSLDGWIWRWSEVEQSIMRHKSLLGNHPVRD